MDLKGWEAHLLAKPTGAKFEGGNKMDRWVMSHIDFLVAAVGAPKS
jgi:hypothetical protein